MTPQEKAQQLFMRNFEITVDDYCAQQCALIAVDEMLKHDEKIIVSHKISSYKTANDFDENFKHIQDELNSYVLSRYSYWQEVKQELKKL
jgi:hypothetical protein